MKITTNFCKTDIYILIYYAFSVAMATAFTIGPSTIHAQHLHHHPEITKSHKVEAERLWGLMNMEQWKREVISGAKIPSHNIDLFFKYMEPQWMKEKILFFDKASRGEINQENVNEYFLTIQQRFIQEYSLFLTIRDQYEFELISADNSPLDGSGQCVNMDFEEGTFNGWTGEIQDRGGRNGNPGNPVPGFGQHCIMTPAQRDPFIPGLSVVAPGATRSVRLGNTAAGGHLARLSQSFIVDSSNMIFTYRYAVVLETPANDDRHQGLDSPHFQAKIYDENGNEITCGEYTVSVVGSNLSSYNHICVDANSNRVDLNNNVGCGNTRTVSPNDVSTPNNNNSCPNNRLEIYYRDWTTVSVGLMDYIGQWVRVEFIAADCQPSGHFGYAYVDAECAPLATPLEEIICSGKETKTLTGPSGFASYSWEPAGKVTGPNNTQSIDITSSGTYTLNLTTISDNPCDIQLTYIVNEYCDIREYETFLCETEAGSGTVQEIDLQDYINLVTENGDWGNVDSWHNQKPTSFNSHLISNPGNISVSNGEIVYAIISRPSYKDTVPLTFTIRPLPEIYFPDVPPVCLNSESFQITGVSPSGGSFSGNHTSSGGIFTPVEPGSFEITYQYTNTNGCTNSLTNNVDVDPHPTTNAGDNQILCENINSISLSASANNATSGLWSGGNGGIFDPNDLNTSYFPVLADLASDSIILTFTTTGSGSCPPAKDSVIIYFEKLSEANAGPSEVLCESSPDISLNGSLTNGTEAVWVGGNGNFLPDRNTLNAQYIPHSNEVSAGSVTLFLRSQGQEICPNHESTVTFDFEKMPFVDPGEGYVICENTSSITLNGTFSHATGVIWSGGNGNFETSDDPNTVYTIDPDDIENGSVTLILSSTDNVICPASSDSITFTIDRLHRVDAGPNDTICANSPQVYLSGYSSSESIWTNGSGAFLPSPNSPSVHYQATEEEIANGKVTLILTSTNNGSCPPVKDTVEVAIIPLPNVDLGDPVTACENESITLMIQNQDNLIYSWKEGDTNLSNDLHFIDVQVRNGTSQYFLTVTDKHWCSATDSVKVIGIPHPVVELRDTSICEGNQVLLQPTITNVASPLSLTPAYSWRKNGRDLNHHQQAIYISDEGQYSLIVSIGNCSGTATSQVSFFPLPSPTLPENIKNCFESNSELNISAGTASSYLWTPYSDTNQTITAYHPGLYEVILTNEHGCSVTDKTLVTEVCPPRLFVSNSFSPNGDFINDRYTVYGVNIGSFNMLIFNRWGEIIFESTDIEMVWDGTYKNEPMIEGVYPWTIIYEGDSPEYIGPYKMQGSVTLIR